LGGSLWMARTLDSRSPVEIYLLLLGTAFTTVASIKVLRQFKMSDATEKY